LKNSFHAPEKKKTNTNTEAKNNKTKKKMNSPLQPLPPFALLLFVALAMVLLFGLLVGYCLKRIQALEQAASNLTVETSGITTIVNNHDDRFLALTR